MSKERIDQLLVTRGFFTSRAQAHGSIMAGLVFVNDERIDKPGTRVVIDAKIKVKGPPIPYVSRGGLKLAEALRVFNIVLNERVMIDIGASTGGFTDCALKNGVKLVYAVDVGYGQLAWKLRQNSRVVVIERTNFRYLHAEKLQYGLPDFATIDVSFISLELILPPLTKLMQNGGEVVALIKPQFEAGRESVGKKGVVKDRNVHEQILSTFFTTCIKNGYTVLNLSTSPIKGAEGNIEFLAHLHFGNSSDSIDKDRLIREVVDRAHSDGIK